VTSLAWSPDGQTLASGSLDGTIRLWAGTGQPLAAWPSQAGHTFAVAWQPGGKILASGSIVTYTQPLVQWWNLQGQIVMTLSTAYSGGKFYNLAWSPDGQYLVGGATDYREWRADGSEVFWRTRCAQCAPAWAMAWSPDSQLWATGNESGEVEIYTRAGRQVAAVNDVTGVNSLAWSPDSRLLAGARTLWRVDGTVLTRLSAGAEYVNSVAWSPDGGMLAAGESDGLVHLYAPDGKRLGLLQGHLKPVTVVAWSPVGRLLASASEDATLRLWAFRP
jgi:WD40 repeat protein